MRLTSALDTLISIARDYIEAEQKASESGTWSDSKGIAEAEKAIDCCRQAMRHWNPQRARGIPDD